MASDDGFREFQLGGKHLVALFMFTTIIAVVIFLCGVMVGRGVRNNTSGAATDAAAAPAPAGDLAAVPDVQAGARAAATPASTAPPAPVEEAVPPAADAAAKTATAPGPEVRTAKPEAPASAKAGTPPPKQPVADTRNAAVTKATPAAAPGATGAGEPISGEPAGPGFVVQVAAMTDRGQADTLARQLLDKGYRAYVMPPPAGGGMFRVRIGKFKERREAEAVVRRLKKEEQRDGWIPPAR